MRTAAHRAADDPRSRGSAVDPDLVPARIDASYSKLPPSAELRSGRIRTFDDAGVSPDARAAGTRGISIRVPDREGRYFLSSLSEWRDECVTATEVFTMVIVESR